MRRVLLVVHLNSDASAGRGARSAVRAIAPGACWPARIRPIASACTTSPPAVEQVSGRGDRHGSFRGDSRSAGRLEDGTGDVAKRASAGRRAQ
jgi:hypothetical protein